MYFEATAPALGYNSYLLRSLNSSGWLRSLNGSHSLEQREDSEMMGISLEKVTAGWDSCGGDAQGKGIRGVVQSQFGFAVKMGEGEEVEVGVNLGLACVVGARCSGAYVRRSWVTGTITVR